MNEALVRCCQCRARSWASLSHAQSDRWRCPACNHNKGLYTKNVKELREEFELMKIEGVEPLGHKRRLKKKQVEVGPTGAPEYQ